MRQGRLEQDGAGLTPAEEPAAAAVVRVEQLRVLELGRLRHRPLCQGGRGRTSRGVGLARSHGPGRRRHVMPRNGESLILWSPTR